MARSKYRDLMNQMANLQKQLDAARQIESRSAIETCKQLIGEFDLTAVDLGFVKTQQIASKKVKPAEKTFVPTKPKMVYPPKYQDPASGKTWSGRGLTPRWINGDRDEYLIREPKPRATQNNRE